MKRFLIILMAIISVPAFARYDNVRFTKEIKEGLDILNAHQDDDIDREAEYAAGELGKDVYGKIGSKEYDGTAVYIPTSMYLRGGAGLTLGAISNKIDGSEMSDGYLLQLGLGWNLSSYTRVEIDLQNKNVRFKDFDEFGKIREIAGNLYFDLARRIVRNGDITIRRTFMPFIGFGIGTGTSIFDNSDGTKLFVRPRGILGISLALTPLWNIDLSYQYSYMLTPNLGWNDSKWTHGFSDIMASVRINF